MQFDNFVPQLGGGSSPGPLIFPTWSVPSMNSPRPATPKAPSSVTPALVSEAWGFGAVEMAPLAPPPPGSKKDDGCEEQEDEGRALKKRRVGSAGSQKSGTTKATTNNATPRSTKKGENSSNAGTPHQAKLARANIRGRPTRDLLALSSPFFCSCRCLLSQFVSGHVLFAESSNHGRSVPDEFRTRDSSHPIFYGTEFKTHKRWMQRMVDDLGTAIEEADDPSEIEKSADPKKGEGLKA